MVPAPKLSPPSLRFPLERAHVTSPFGLRTHPLTGKRSGHGGVDFRAAIGTPVYAAADGQVTHNYVSKGDGLPATDPEKKRWAYGEVIYIQHAGDCETRYAHLSKRMVRVGQEVKAGQLIGYSGNTGDSSGPHLHFEFRHADVPLVPMPYFARLP